MLLNVGSSALTFCYINNCFIISTVTFENVCRVHTKRQVLKMCKFNMFITAVSEIFLLNLCLAAEKTTFMCTLALTEMTKDIIFEIVR